MKNKTSLSDLGEKSYKKWQNELRSQSEYQSIFEEEASKSELWLQLVEARQTAGLTQKEMARRLAVSQAQVARIEKKGYDSYTLNTLRRYVKALGQGYTLEVNVRITQSHELSHKTVATF